MSIPVYILQDSTVTDVLFSAITRAGSFIDMSNCRWLIVKGAVTLGGTKLVHPHQKPVLGEQELVIDGKKYDINIQLSSYE